MNLNHPIRMRRLRHNQTLRNIIRETRLSINDFILPLFIRFGENIQKPISSMPGHSQISLDHIPDAIKEIQDLGIPGVILFGIPQEKDADGHSSIGPAGIIQTAIQTIKDLAPDLFVVADTCFCDYTEHGHCGIINTKTGKADVDNDASLELLAELALSYAAAGADMIAPSGSLDGMVQAIRNMLDKNQYQHLPIMSYSVKYASALYGPFREAAESSPQFGDRRSYQMDPANGREALKEVMLDLDEGADILMVKPALAYLDVIHTIKQEFPHTPLAAYQVSGEYAMIKAASANGWLDEKAVALETLTAIKRAGADIIISYFAKDVARWLQMIG